MIENSKIDLDKLQDYVVKMSIKYTKLQKAKQFKVNTIDVLTDFADLMDLVEGRKPGSELTPDELYQRMVNDGLVED